MPMGLLPDSDPKTISLRLIATAAAAASAVAAAAASAVAAATNVAAASAATTAIAVAPTAVTKPAPTPALAHSVAGRLRVQHRQRHPHWRRFQRPVARLRAVHEDQCDAGRATRVRAQERFNVPLLLVRLRCLARGA